MKTLARVFIILLAIKLCCLSSLGQTSDTQRLSSETKSQSDNHSTNNTEKQEASRIATTTDVEDYKNPTWVKVLAIVGLLMIVAPVPFHVIDRFKKHLPKRE